jgi:hypothetical protein
VLLSSPTLTPCHPCHYIDPPSPCVASADPEIKKVRSDRALRELRAMQGLGGEKGEEDMMQMDVVAEGMCAMMMMIMMMPPPPPHGARVCKHPVSFCRAVRCGCHGIQSLT